MAKKKQREPFDGKGDHDANGITGGARGPVEVGEVVTVYTRNPINGQLVNNGVVTKLMPNDRVVVSVAYDQGGETVFPVTLGAGDQYYERKPLAPVEPVAPAVEKIVEEDAGNGS
jgi:hypothetical protein